MADKGGNKKKLIIIIIIAALLLSSIGFGVYYFFLRNDDGSNVTKVMNEAMFPVGEFVVNLTDEKSNKFLKVNIVLGYEEDSDFNEELTKYTVKIRDSINTLLRSKNSDELDSFGVEQLKRQLKIRINSITEKGEVTDVYFDNIIIQ